MLKALLVFVFAGSLFAQTNGWQTIANTHIQGVCPPNNFGGSGYNFSDACAYVVRAWSGAVMDTKRNRMILWGGGHTDYKGNELYSFQFSGTNPAGAKACAPANPPNVCRLDDPSLPVDQGETNTDGTPGSRHTYQGCNYVANQDVMICYGGGLASGAGSAEWWKLDLAAREAGAAKSGYWTHLAPTGYAPGGTPNGMNCDYEWVTNKIFCLNQYLNGMFSYNPATNAITGKLNRGNFLPITNFSVTMAIDPVRRKGFFMGSESGNFYAISVDLSAGSTFASTNETANFTGCSGMNVISPGLVYDPAHPGYLFGWPNTGNTVYMINTITKQCIAQTRTGGPVTTPFGSTTGTFGRFRLSTQSGKFVAINGVDSNFFLYTHDLTLEK